jgi:predicted Zn finger-like uncharacterized protein
MILTCPNCATQYSVDLDHIGPEGRMVRCKQCVHVWREFPHEQEDKQSEDAPQPAVEAIPQPKVEVAAPHRRRSALPRERPKRANLAGWVALGAILLAVLGGGWLMRERVVDAWPASARLFAALGTPVEVLGAGIEIADVTSARDVVEGVPVLLIEGRLTNISEAVRTVPAVRASLLDQSAREVRSWLVPILEQRLLPGETVAFTTRLENPPDEARELAITFVDSE